MVILKKKKEEIMDFKEIKEIVEDKEKNVLSKTEQPKEIQQIEKKGVPLFVKLDKYKSILDILNDMKSILFFAKNTINVQKQIEMLLEENKKLLEDAIAKLDQKLLYLEKELTKPGLYETKIEEQKEEIKDFDKVLEDLKKQIESLKGDLKNIS
ncbi:MAG: hypothetical protein KQA41_02120 [Candidatus Aenigmarchaeota archaeon]|nr:hypothetical protein [Candidatus Aenigmarchaeota archaeon]MBU5688998.1 hypothetical protein [Candidatus Aenigmarchaeota archaeon]